MGLGDVIGRSSDIDTDGCDDVFHVATPLDFEERERESKEVKVRRVTTGTRAILQACAHSKIVLRLLRTSTLGTVTFNAEFFGSSGTPDAVDTPERIKNCQIATSISKFGVLLD
ncbi:NAD(P)-binding Rossmann-fold superfamily protein [Striga asiatica]|uniref:NAD(P)-binding Rossmann-fold superfamily protein n=1 Tax=Striga asiatica TaxID=4170 RepID=A0A5A7QZ59_STRAF|nr:NAD(P)-binding Rossmann-fold superfamily protein [Striga asiatica]